MSYQPSIIRTIAGTGERGYSGDGGPAGAALLSEPFMCAFDAAGNLYVAESMNHCVRRVDRDTGVIVTIAGTGSRGLFRRRGPGDSGGVQPTIFDTGRRQRRCVRC